MSDSPLFVCVGAWGLGGCSVFATCWIHPYLKRGVLNLCNMSDSPLFKGGGGGGGGGDCSIFVCLFVFDVLMILCRKEVRYIRLVNYIYSNRYTLSSLRANLFLLPLFWVNVSLGNNLRAESLYLAIVTFGIVRDFVVWRLSFSIAGATSLHVSLSRVKVRQPRSRRITWFLIRLMDGLLIWLTCYWWSVPKLKED